MSKEVGSTPKQSRRLLRAKSSDLLLRANRMLGKAYDYLWRALRWMAMDGFPWMLKRLLDVGTLVGILYLVWDSFYQTTVGLSFVYSDPATALENPIAMQNKSNLFWIRNITWTCVLLEATYDNNSGASNIGIQFNGNIGAIAPGAAINIACLKRRVLNQPGIKLASARIIMVANYDADFFGIWFYRRRITVPFTWAGAIAQPQWVQWPFIQ